MRAGKNIVHPGCKSRRLQPLTTSWGLVHFHLNLCGFDGIEWVLIHSKSKYLLISSNLVQSIWDRNKWTRSKWVQQRSALKRWGSSLQILTPSVGQLRTLWLTMQPGNTHLKAQDAGDPAASSPGNTHLDSLAPLSGCSESVEVVASGDVVDKGERWGGYIWFRWRRYRGWGRWSRLGLVVAVTNGIGWDSRWWL